MRFRDIAKKFLPENIKKIVVWIIYDRDIRLFCRHRLMITKGEQIWGNSIKKIKQKTKIRIAFLFASASYWTGDQLYNNFANDNRFEVYAIVIPFFNGTNVTIQEEYERTICFFEKKGISVVGTIKDRLHNNRSWKECGRPDVIFYANPHVTAYPSAWRPQKLPRNVLSFYIPYGFLVANIVQMQFNQKSHHLFWRIFCESEISKQLFAKYSDIGDRNVVFSGYPKMDAFNGLNVGHKWKGLASAKKFIYSPHHSLSMEKQGLEQSTFKLNYKFMIDLARKYSDTTSWIFRPHPLLEKACIETGMFTEKEWNYYLRCWDSLPNCEVQISGTYVDVFESCDGIINDSVSYMAEILYAHKPMLYLKSAKAAFNEFGETLEKIHYECAGDDYQAIEDFVVMILEGEDSMKEEREKYFNDNLNYMRSNGMSASDYVYKYVKDTVTKI